MAPMESFSTRALNWYDKNARRLPWRVSPQDGKNGVMPNPYHVWLSEVMLQQTTVAAVKSYFKKFLTLWPELEDLAAAEEDDVMRAWAGLGYYSRARNLKACGDIVVENFGGEFPRTQQELIMLPGIGEYTSAAIAAIAFGEKTQVVDANIERVVARYSANPTPLPRLKTDCRELMGMVTPAKRPGDFVQAMMDLGATICTPKNPKCPACPFREDCLSYNDKTALNFPVKAPKKTKPSRKGAVFVIERSDGAIWLEKRGGKGMLAGMAGLPTTGWGVSQNGEVGENSVLFAGKWRFRGTIRHSFTHFHLELEVWHIHSQKCPKSGWWSQRKKISQEALPTVMKKAVSVVLPGIFQLTRKPL